MHEQHGFNPKIFLARVLSEESNPVIDAAGDRAGQEASDDRQAVLDKLFDPELEEDRVLELLLKKYCVEHSISPENIVPEEVLVWLNNREDFLKLNLSQEKVRGSILDFMRMFSFIGMDDLREMMAMDELLLPPAGKIAEALQEMVDSFETSNQYKTVFTAMLEAILRKIKDGANAEQVRGFLSEQYQEITKQIAAKPSGQNKGVFLLGPLSTLRDLMAEIDDLDAFKQAVEWVINGQWNAMTIGEDEGS